MTGVEIRIQNQTVDELIQQYKTCKAIYDYNKPHMTNKDAEHGAIRLGLLRGYIKTLGGEI